MHHMITKETEQKFEFNELHDDDDQLMQGNQQHSVRKSSYAYILPACVKQQIQGIQFLVFEDQFMDLSFA